jgi:hypothetical protein
LISIRAGGVAQVVKCLPSKQYSQKRNYNFNPLISITSEQNPESLVQAIQGVAPAPLSDLIFPHIDMPSFPALLASAFASVLVSHCCCNKHYKLSDSPLFLFLLS